MELCKPTSVPMQVNLELTPDEENEERLPYPQLVGALLFLARLSRLDIAYAVSRLSRFMNSYGQVHWDAAKKILRYLKGTKELGLFYKRGCSMELTGFCDSDYAGDKFDRKSTGGFVFLIGDGILTWCSQKQRVVACSSTEAEYIALADAAREAQWLRCFLEELQFTQQNPTTIHVDNQSTIKLAMNPEFHKRTKHIAVRYHYTRQLITEKIIKVE